MITTPLPTCAHPFNLPSWAQEAWSQGLATLAHQGIHALSVEMRRFYVGNYGFDLLDRTAAWWHQDNKLRMCAMDTTSIIEAATQAQQPASLAALSAAHFLASLLSGVQFLRPTIVGVFERDHNVVVSTEPQQFQLFLLPGAITIASNSINATRKWNTTPVPPQPKELLVVTNAQDNAHAQMAALSNARDFWQAWWTVGTHDNDATTTPLIAPFKPVAAFP